MKKTNIHVEHLIIHIALKNVFFFIAWEPKCISLVIEDKNKKRTSENPLGRNLMQPYVFMAKISPQ